MRIAACLAFLLALPAPAFAVEAPAIVDPDTEAARRHYERGVTLYDAQNYTDALSEFETARALKPLPAFDFNIARVLDRLERWSEAADAYARYLAVLKPGSEADEVRERIGVLRERSKPASPPPAPVQVAAPSPLVAPPLQVPPPKRHRLATWVVAGAGAAMLAGSLAAQLVAQDRLSRLRANCNADDRTCDPSRAPDWQAWSESGKAAAFSSDVLLATGLAAVATSAILFFVEGRQMERRAWNVTPTVSTHGAGFAFGFER